MKALKKFLKSTYGNILHSIAFYPVLISLVFVLFAVTSISSEKIELIANLKSKIPYIFIEDYETARTILATLFGGILSLTVFSFTMVMVVLGQASSNFSPRLLPGLISNKRHQIILGIYIGTLTYVIITLISLGAYGMDSRSLGLSTMMAALFGVLCVGLFVYFIHSISGAIQIHNIITLIYKESDKWLDREYQKQEKAKEGVTQDTRDWNVISIDRSGYYRGFDHSLLPESFKKQKHYIELTVYTNKHLWAGDTIFKTREVLTDDEKQSLLFCLTIASDRHENESAIDGLIKLMEVSVKALSPGINDPGTAIDSLAKIARLIRKMFGLPPARETELEHPDLLLIENQIPAEEVMRTIIQPIRHYSSDDMAVQYELVAALKYIRNSPAITAHYLAAVKQELDLISDSLKKGPPDIDKQRVLAFIST